MHYDDWRVPDQNGVSLLYIMLAIHHSGWEPLICHRKNLIHCCGFNYEDNNNNNNNNNERISRAPFHVKHAQLH